MFGRLFATVGNWAGAHGLLGRPDIEYIAIYHDDPEVTAPENLRISVGVTVLPDTSVTGEVSLLEYRLAASSAPGSRSTPANSVLPGNTFAASICRKAGSRATGHATSPTSTIAESIRSTSTLLKLDERQTTVTGRAGP